MIQEISKTLGLLVGLTVGVGMSWIQMLSNPPEWLSGLNTLLLTGTMTLLVWSIVTARKIEKRQNAIEAVLFKGSAQDGARRFLETWENNFTALGTRIGALDEKQSQRLQVIETTLWGKNGHGGFLNEIKALRDRSHEFSNRIMAMSGKLEHIEKSLEDVDKDLKKILWGRGKNPSG